jgi:phosphoheptose isomerase
MRKEVKQVVQIAEKHGLTCIGLNGKSHWTLQHHSGVKITVPSSPSRGRWRQNALADIKRIYRNNQKETS